ncbi:TatD-related DNase [Klebsormidium nitens]|uniref:TatD-related DNase n=1 Tax=Klebsormidium nitens TaxID=105231 RepID=A0A1Y1IVC3_KLENI|nr:TatD-related DNase [Klebsormidium nitens]|eukprot:GAQ93341.1 TatD-related DNase [Klebsormidium nitens]
MEDRGSHFFDAHCHLQDPRLDGKIDEVLKLASGAGVRWCAVNGTSEDDWDKVRALCEHYPQLLPNLGLHPWYVGQRSPNWLEALRERLEQVPEAAIGEVGLDKGRKGSEVPIEEQVEVFRAQVELARDLERPVSIHCVRAFGELHDVLKSVGRFPAGVLLHWARCVLLHSWMGSAEMVKALAPLNAYFSISGFITGMSSKKADKMLRQVSGPLDDVIVSFSIYFELNAVFCQLAGWCIIVRNSFLLVSGLITGRPNFYVRCGVLLIPLDRLLLETDSPDAFPDADPSILTPLSSGSPSDRSDSTGQSDSPGCSCGDNASQQLVGEVATKSGEHFSQSPRKSPSGGERERDKERRTEEEKLNHPANLRAAALSLWLRRFPKMVERG